MNGKERRRHPRVTLNCPGVIRLGKGEEINTQVIEISEGGLSCVFPQATPLGSSTELRFTLPLATRKECLVVGRVQHYHRDNESYLLGIEFTRTTADLVQAIRTFVQQTIKRSE